jgi:hypothetical protein
MYRKKFIYIRLIIALIFLVSMLVIWIIKEKYLITTKDISYLGSFMIALYAFVYGVENIFLKKINFGVFLIVFSIMIFILNIYMMRVVII